ncbi:MAG: carboxypeptidase regulatory-like domain-containing protein [Planctomycetes bacterium]|nr:carboxypeptidase regulatory-like domain-containing protein [Planctomycetota bacterium]
MRGRTLLIVLPVLLLLAALAAWLMLAPGESRPARPNAGGAQVPVAKAAPPAVAPAELPPAAAESTPLPLAPAGTEGSAPEAQPSQPAGATPASPGGGTQPSSPGTNPPRRAPGNIRQDPPRNLTPAEREEQARINGGRARHEREVGLTPAVAERNQPALRKSLKPDEWKQAFRDEGLEAPEMTPTPVTGKLMSPISREGIADASLRMISFLPLNNQPGGALYPVITDLRTDALGNFSGQIPAPLRAPQGHPTLGIAVDLVQPVDANQDPTLTGLGNRILAGYPIAALRPGETNALGILWAPETPFDVDCDAGQFNYAAGKLVLCCTGELDPQRWHPVRAAALLAEFPQVAVPAEAQDPARRGRTLLRSTWDGSDAPFVTLLESGSPLQTRRCARPRQKSESSDSKAIEIPRPFDVLVFENAGYTAITGQVVDADGAPVAGAVVETLGDPTPQRALTDGSGWFTVAQPGKAVSALRFSHDDFITQEKSGVTPGASGVLLAFANRKPVLWFTLRDSRSQALLTSVTLELHEAASNSQAIKARTETRELTSATGEYVVKAEFLLHSVALQKVGYFPRTVQNPQAAQAAAAGPMALVLAPGRELTVRPRDYTAVEDAERWFPDSKPEDPGIYTAWQTHWIEWQVEFGAQPEPGVEGGSFDLLLGCTNHGIVDNDYQFAVDVYVDGQKKGSLSILADSLHEQTGRLALGKLAGAHTIRLVWTNDKWIPDQLDANIRYASMKFLEQP